jgi:lipopolysaccharide transport system ATP-binding protein
MNSSAAITVEGLGKRYVLGGGNAGQLTFREALVETARGLFRSRADTNVAPEFWALRDASFSIGRGENVGIVGLNGAGKSTLLKILSRITEPTTGRARINGRLGALLEVGTGFHSELTGRENVFLYGSILGMSRAEISSKFDAIVAFSGIEKFIDTPVKRYSSGMYVRLAFAVAAHLDPEILLLDEVLAVGDLAFQRKCLDHAKSLQRRDATILFVSHNMFSIKSMCDRVIYLRRGEVVFDGAVEKGIELYESDCKLSDVPWIGADAKAGPIRVSKFVALGEDGSERSMFEFGERMRFRIEYDASAPIERPNFIVAFTRSDGVAACNFSTETDGLELDVADGHGVIELLTPPIKLVAESYTVSVIVRRPGMQALLCGQVGGVIHVRHELFNMHFGVFHERAESWNHVAAVGSPAVATPRRSTAR